MNLPDRQPPGVPIDTEPRLSRRHVLGTAGSFVLAVVAVACANDGPTGNRLAPHAVEPNGVVVDILSIDNTFNPPRVEITPGTEVRWTNRGRTAHDIVPVEGTEWGVATEDFPPEATYSHVFGAVGEVPYYCSIHGTAEFGMVGMIVVVDELTSATSAP